WKKAHGHSALLPRFRAALGRRPRVEPALPQDPARAADRVRAVRHPVPAAAEPAAHGDGGGSAAASGARHAGEQAETAAATAAAARGEAEDRAAEEAGGEAAGRSEAAGAPEGAEVAQPVQGRARRPARADGSEPAADEE